MEGYLHAWGTHLNKLVLPLDLVDPGVFAAITACSGLGEFGLTFPRVRPFYFAVSAPLQGSAPPATGAAACTFPLVHCPKVLLLHAADERTAFVMLSVFLSPYATAGPPVAAAATTARTSLASGAPLRVLTFPRLESPPTLPRLLAMLPAHLNALFLGQCPHLGDAAVAELTSRCPFLEELQVIGNA